MAKTSSDGVVDDLTVEIEVSLDNFGNRSGGSGGGSGDFYGHRVATDEIDFRNGSTEMGLMRSCEHYMLLNKHRL